MSQKKLIIDENCIWCGSCAAICSDVFDMDDTEWKAYVKADYDEKDVDCINNTISMCPVDAIHYN